MELRKPRHVSGELGMSSMADILFILLMFFMMTSTLVAPSALDLTLPGRSNAPSKLANSRLSDISIGENGKYRLNGRNIDLPALEQAMQREAAKGTEENKVNVIVAPDEQAPVENVVAVLDITTKLGINAILSTE